MATRAWNSGDPAGSDAPGTIDDSIRRVRQDIAERLVQGGHKFGGLTPPAPGASDTTEGLPCVGVETQSNQNDQGYLTMGWDFAGTTYKVRLYGGSHATKASRLEIPGDLSKNDGTLYIKGGIAVGADTRTIAYDAIPVASAYLPVVVYKVASFTGAPNRTLTKIMVAAGTRPVGADLVVTVRQLTAPAVSVNRFIDGSSSQITSVTLVQAGNYAVETTGLALALAPDDELVIKYGTVGTTTVAADVTVLLQIE